MAKVQQTSLEAYERDLEEAEKSFVAAGAAVAKAQDALNARRVQDGLKPVDFSAAPEDEEKAEEDHSEEENTNAPEDASGFGEPNKPGNSRRGRR